MARSSSISYLLVAAVTAAWGCGGGDAASSSAAQCSPPRFPAQMVRFGADRIEGIAVADLNQDSHVDIVTALILSSAIGIALGRGDGTFEPEYLVRTEGQPRAVAIADLNRDRQPDILAPTSGPTQHLSVLLGHGDGTFSAELQTEVGDDPAAVAVADLDADGRLDAVVGNHGPFTSGDDVSVLLGRGDGTFAAQQRYRVGRNPRGIALGDANGDGRLDIVTANSVEFAGGSDDVALLLGRGDGSFVRGQSLPIGASARAVVIADWDRDGRSDLAVSDGLGASVIGGVSVFFGDWAGFDVAQRYVDGPPWGGLLAGDVDRDGIADLIAAGRAGVTLLTGTGGRELRVAPAFGGPAGHLALADVNEDGAADLVAASETVAVILATRPGAFPASHRYSTGTQGVAINSVVIVDVNRDRAPDVVTLDQAGVAVFAGVGDGSFTGPLRFDAGDGPGSFAVADLNLDGITDVVATSEHHGTVAVLLGNPEGHFIESGSILVGPAPQSVALPDLNGDRIPDLATAHLGSFLAVGLGRGDGTFFPVAHLALSRGAGVFVSGAELDGDGAVDVIGWSRELYPGFRYALVAFRGRGDGTFGPEETLATVVGSFENPVLAVGDRNHDGRLDIVVKESETELSLQLGDEAARRVPTGLPLVAVQDNVVTADTNDDARSDLATITMNGFSLFLGREDDYCRAAHFSTGTDGRAIAIGDLNGDGKADAVTAGGSEIAVLLAGPSD